MTTLDVKRLDDDDYSPQEIVDLFAQFLWQPIKTAPKDGTPFEAWYVSSYGPKFGPMEWRGKAPDDEKGYFFSFAVGTETHKATHWRQAPEPPE